MSDVVITEITEKVKVSLQNDKSRLNAGATGIVKYNEGPRGEKGEKGEDGYTPIKGVDYFDGYTPKKGVDYFDGYTPVKGVDYFDGEQGEKGEPFRYEDFTQEQLDSLKVKGDKGEQGERGNAFTFSDFTPEQLESLKVKGDKGDDGYTPIKGVDYFDGSKGEKGDPFKYEDFTHAQLEALKVKGDKGDKGDSYTITQSDYQAIAQLVPLDETDPTVPSYVKSIAQSDITKWNKIDELQLFKFPNATIVGQPTINNGQISNFTTSNYLRFPFVVDFANRPFIIDFEITTGNDVTTQQNILDSHFGFAFAIRSGKFITAISTNGTSWNIGESVGTHSIGTNTTYRVKIEWNGSTIVFSFSTDGGLNFITDITKSLSVNPYPKQMYIGVSNVLDVITNPFKGIVNMNYASLTISNKVVWTGMDDVGLATRLAVDLSNVDSAGVQKIKDIASQTQVEESDPTVPSYVKAITEADISNWNGKQPSGNYALKSEIPSDDHINSLINTALGVIENGTY